MPRLAELFVAEITEGMRPDHDPDGPSTGVRAGVVKVAGGFHSLDAHARAALAAAAEAHHATGVPIVVHHELGTAAPDVLDLLCGRHRVPPGSVILGHLNRHPDSRVHLRLAEAGAWLAFDGPSRANHATDWRLLDCLRTLAGAGHADRILLGGDTTAATARTEPGMGYLLRTLRPALEAELGTAAASAVFTDNPARAFAAHFRSGRAGKRSRQVA